MDVASPARNGFALVVAIAQTGRLRASLRASAETLLVVVMVVLPVDGAPKAWTLLVVGLEGAAPPSNGPLGLE